MDKEQFINLVIESLEAIEDQYRIPYKTRPYERIICYEFYHQFRKRVDKTICSFVLHGELDKRYRGIERVPDFIFHVPHEDERNFAVIEFKSTRSGIRWIKYDLKKFQKFRDHPLNYQMGILIVFGRKDKLNRVQEKLKSLGQMESELDILFYDLDSGKVINQLSVEKTSTP